MTLTPGAVQQGKGPVALEGRHMLVRDNGEGI